MNKDHPINMVCKLFREAFWDRMGKYAQPIKKKNGIVDKAAVIVLYKEKTEELKKDYNQNYQKLESENNFEDLERDIDGDSHINLTN